MNPEQLKPITDKLARLCFLYEATSGLMNEHEPPTMLLDNLNEQFRNILDDLDKLGVMS